MRPLARLAGIPLRVQLTVALVLLLVGIASIFGIVSYKLLAASLLSGAVDGVNAQASSLRDSAFTSISEKRDHVGSTLKTIELGCGISGLMNTSCARDMLVKFVDSEHAIAARLHFDKRRNIQIGTMIDVPPDDSKPFASLHLRKDAQPFIVIERNDSSSGLALSVQFPADIMVTSARQDAIETMLVTMDGSTPRTVLSGDLPDAVRNSAEVHSCLAENDRMAEFANDSSRPFLVASVQIPQVKPLCSVAVVPQSSVLVPADRWKTKLFSIKLVAATLGLIVAYAVAMFLTSPLRKLSKRIKTFREGDYDSPFPLVGSGELRELATALSEMARSVRSSRDALLQSEERMSLACQAANLWIWQHDLRTGKIQWSDPSKIHPSFLSSTFRGLLRRLHPEDRHGMCVAVRTAKLTGLYSCEYRTYDPQGNLVWLASWGQLQSKREGLMTGVCLEITSRKRAEALAIEKEKLDATSQMAAALAHEINNPLTSIISAIYMVDSGAATPEQKNYLRIAEQESRRVAQIAKQILALYRKPTIAEAFDFKALLDGSISACDLALQRKRLSIERKIEYLGRVIAYRDELRHALSNLLTNAIESAPAGSTINIRARQSHSWKHPGERGVRILVTNAGPGIPKEKLASMFEPFTGTKAERGTGLGLWVTRVAVLKQGGTIRIRTAKDTNRGTVVSIYIPSRMQTQAPPPLDVIRTFPPAAVS